MDPRLRSSSLFQPAICPGWKGLPSPRSLRHVFQRSSFPQNRYALDTEQGTIPGAGSSPFSTVPAWFPTGLRLRFTPSVAPETSRARVGSSQLPSHRWGFLGALLSLIHSLGGTMRSGTMSSCTELRDYSCCGLVGAAEGFVPLGDRCHHPGGPVTWWRGAARPAGCSPASARVYINHKVLRSKKEQWVEGEILLSSPAAADQKE